LHYRLAGSVAGSAVERCAMGRVVDCAERGRGERERREGEERGRGERERRAIC
jgi:hypothetical protein